MLRRIIGIALVAGLVRWLMRVWLHRERQRIMRKVKMNLRQKTDWRRLLETARHYVGECVIRVARLIRN